MGTARTAGTAALLAVEVGLAGLGISVHFGLTAEYGDITGSTVEAWLSGFTTGVNGMALVLVVLVGLVVVLVTSERWARLVAGAVPVLMLVGMLVVTPAALGQKLEVQYDAVPQCGTGDDVGAGPGSEAQRRSQEAFDSIEHVGHFGGGGGSGVGGCDRPFLLTEDVDVLQHYRTALPAAGWTVVEDDARHLRAERDDLAFEVVTCDRGGVVWAGSAGSRGVARCDGR